MASIGGDELDYSSSSDSDEGDLSDNKVHFLKVVGPSVKKKIEKKTTGFIPIFQAGLLCLSLICFSL